MTEEDNLERKVDLALENIRLKCENKQLQQKTRLLEEELKPYQLAKKLKPGRLGVLLGDGSRNHLNGSFIREHLNGLKVTITDGTHEYYRTTQRCSGEAFYPPAFDDDGNRLKRKNRNVDYGPADGYCEFTELNGGNYNVSVRYGQNIFGADITIDGNTLAELALNESNLKKEGEDKPSSPTKNKCAGAFPGTPKKTLFSAKKRKLMLISLAAVVGIAGISYLARTVPIFNDHYQFPDGTYKYERKYITGRTETYICDSEKKTCKPVTE